MKRIALSIITALLIFSYCHAQKSAARWFKKQEISKGMPAMPSPTVNQEEFARQYQANKVLWDKAFEFMKNNDLKSLAPGKYPIDGDLVYASITEGVDQPLENTKWESHRKYLDLQYIISGAEKMGIANPEGQEVTMPYDAARDVANYNIAVGDLTLATPEYFFLFFPFDAHRPTIKVNDEPVKKLVIKIKMAE